MCEIDWTALGTWAAVVVALAIAVEDKVFRRVRQRSERIALAALIRADLSLALFHVRKLAEEIAADEGADVHGIADALTYKDEPARAEVIRRGGLIDVPAIRTGADRLYIFDAQTAGALAEVVTAVRAVKTGCETMSNPLPNHDIFCDFMDALRTAVTETKLKVEQANRLLATQK